MKPRFPALLLLLLTAHGCGKMGDPMPPPRYVPAPTKDLKAEQRGSEITLRLAHPQTTVGGSALPGLEAVELWQIERPVVEGEELGAIDAREFAAIATRALVLRGAELKGSISGDRIQIRYRLEQPEEPTGYTFAVRTVSGTNETSDLSNQVTLVPVAAPAPPRTIAIIAKGDGIEIHWESESDDLEGFHVYRRDAQSRQYGEPLGLAKPLERSFMDSTAQFGERYIYALRSVARLTPLVESTTAVEKEVHYRDLFAPPIPTDLLALPEEGQVRLRWRASKAEDVAGYVLFRADPGAEFRRLQDQPLAATEFLDTGLVTGLVYRYQILAVDQKGNESNRSEIVEARSR